MNDGSSLNVYLENDRISYSCTNPLFSIEGNDVAICQSDGSFSPSTITDCIQTCEFGTHAVNVLYIGCD